MSSLLTERTEPTNHFQAGGIASGGPSPVVPGHDAAWPRFAVAAWALLAAAVAAALGPRLLEFGQRLWSSEHYGFFPLLLACVAWLAFRRAGTTPAADVQAGFAPLRFSLWLVGLTLAAVAALLRSPYVAALALLAVLLAGCYQLGGGRLARRLLPVWALLLLVVPPPFGLQESFVNTLQMISTAMASGFLDTAGFRHIADGIVIRTPGTTFFVDEACSGIHSLFASVTFAAVLAVASRYGLFRSIALLLATVAWVVLGNAARVIGVVWLSTRFGLPITEGVGHDLWGLVTFAAIIGLVLSTDRLFRFLISPHRASTSAVVGGATSKGARLWDGFAATWPRRTGEVFAVAGLFVCLAGADFALRDRGPGEAAKPASVPAWLSALDEDEVPTSADGWERLGFRARRETKLDPSGEWSRIWTFHKGGLTATVSIDGPYPEWHDLALCYRGLGYIPVSHRTFAGRPEPARLTELRLEHPSGRHATSIFVALGPDGRPTPPPNPLWKRLSEFATFGGGAAPAAPSQVYQVQVFSEGQRPFSDDDLIALQQLFDGVVPRIAEAAGAPAPGPGVAREERR